MKRVLIIAAAAAVLLSPFAAAGQARGGWGRSDAGAYQRYPMADRDRDGRGGGWQGGGRGQNDGRGRYEGGAPDRYEPGPEGRRGLEPRGAPLPYPATPSRGARSWRQGDYLPPMYRGAVVQNPGRYRLRTPPPGYNWVGVGPDIYLMQRGTGMVLDTIPGGF